MIYRKKLDEHDREILIRLMKGARSNVIARDLGFQPPSVSYRLEQVQYLCKAKTIVAAVATIALGAKTVEEAVDRFIKEHGVPDAQ